jgi:hypothetical protein
MPEKLRAYKPDAPLEYAISVHSLKSTSYTIGANRIGRQAEELEAAANSGNTEFINTYNDALITMLEKLIPKLKFFLEDVEAKKQKPLQPAPDPALLTRVLEACTAYDMERLDAVMEQLELYEYESQDELIKWLREQINTSELEKIIERLSNSITS